MATHFSNKSFINFLIAQDIFSLNKGSTAQHFIINQYTKIIFPGIMSDIGVVKVSAAGKSQFKVLQYEILEIKPNTTYANESTICFRSGISLSSIGTVQVFIFVDTTNFHIVDTFISFFFV